MELEAEWNGRIRIWLEELKNHMFEKLSDVEFSGFITKQKYSYEEAMKQKFTPMPKGTPWGGKWEYGWFQTEILLPQKAEGKRICLKPEVGGEMLVFVNGKVSGARDLKHNQITLTRCAKAGERFFVAAESYAGHGPRLENGGPCPVSRIPVPEPPTFQVMTGASAIGIWNEEVFQLFMDAYTLSRLLEGLDKKSLRAMKIREGLAEFTCLVDFEQDSNGFKSSIQRARKRLAPLLSCVNGSTAPEFTIFGQSHLDLAWLWPWEETKRKCARTLSTQMDLSDEYEEYQFLLCEPPIMEAVKTYYPQLYDRLKKKVEEGAFLPEGGMYVEPDTNLVSGESLIRQCLYGRKWFREEMGIESVMVWLPDCFGFSGQLPQIMKGCGLKYFATQKMARALKGCDEFPYHNFWWEGIDGTRILTHFYKKNNARLDPYDLISRWEKDRVQQTNIHTFLFPFGYGDGGGGATREMLEVAKRVKDLEGVPRTKMESPVLFFRRLEQENRVKEVYKGELYLPWHRGTYTSQAWLKKENRKLELKLREAELWSSVATFLKGTYNWREKLEVLWKTLLFHQFHDILPGTSITRVYEDARKELKKMEEEVEAIQNEAMESLFDRDREHLVIFNPLSWEREEVIEIPSFRGDVFYQNGKQLKTQRKGESLLVPVVVPSCGYAEIKGGKDLDAEKSRNDSKKACRIYKEAGTFIMDNDEIHVVVDNKGQILHVIDRQTGTEYIDQPSNQMLLYQDINVDYDAWEMNSFYEKLPIHLSGTVKVIIKESGPVLVSLLVTRMLHDSPMEQEIVLRYHSRRVDFITRIDWRETHKLLKVGFSVCVQSEESIEEIQFGYVKRPTHRNRRQDADRFEVSCHRYAALSEPGRTAALLNDCKYGISTLNNRMDLTLLKSPVWPDMYADKGIQDFTYSFYGADRDFADSGVIREGMELNVPFRVLKKGEGRREFFRIDSDSVLLETVKMAEDGSGDLIMRLYESAGRHACCTVLMDFMVEFVWETSMEEILLEGKSIPVTHQKGQSFIGAEWTPFEIKTVRVRGKGL
ncbi:glycoside hydrolase family 38 C-terminal domain-containing protein [Clostridium sp. E02]|uniref:alpha-mannosidase n=1 Tax=Clostridium sp. E02 TaxID=2487134 RepID=UPI000F52515F|nr:glycoside hydrolase family 38 C-terminal domain-containing protein [Clostridium sp. E02]